MPKNFGAHGRASSSTGSGAKRAGGPSPKHRGGAAGAAAAKKSRWSSDERLARGRSAERPRGGDRAVGDRNDRTSRPERAADGRPNWEPRGKDAKRPVERSDRRPFGERSERPRRDVQDDRPQRVEPRERAWEREERGARPERSERPRREYSDDRPRREFREDRPRRDDRADRPRREYRDDRPRREFREDRPRRDSFGDRPRAEHVRRDHDARSTERRERVREDRAERTSYQDDVVLERLQAQAIDAAEVGETTFGDLGIGQNIVRALNDLGATTPFPIQAGTIPEVLAGRDVLGRGRTGSGKTIAFGAPVVERLLQLRAELTSGQRRQVGRAPRALILAPTRELALQIDRTVQPLAQSVGLFTTQLYGGVPYARQLGALSRGVDIVIGTPGRIGDLVERGSLDLSQIVVTVLDEADHMCDLGFLEPVQDLLRRTPEGSQRLLFSATLDQAVASLVDEFLHEPSVHEVAGEDQNSSTIDHRVFVLDQRDKLEVLTQLAEGPGSKLVFVRTRAFAEDVVDLLEDHDIKAVALHGDLNQSRRTRNLERFTSGKARVLVATDVAARGIHVDDVALVIQADAPDEYKTYLHRSGRTGRAGKDGIVVTLAPRNRRRRTQDLLHRAEIEAEWTDVRPGDAAVEELADRANA